jgi:hypothetical protein
MLKSFTCVYAGLLPPCSMTSRPTPFLLTACTQRNKYFADATTGFSPRKCKLSTISLSNVIIFKALILSKKCSTLHEWTEHKYYYCILTGFNAGIFMLLTWIQKHTIHSILAIFHPWPGFPLTNILHTQNKYITGCFLRTKFGQHKGTMCNIKKPKKSITEIYPVTFLHYKTIILPSLLKVYRRNHFSNKNKKNEARQTFTSSYLETYSQTLLPETNGKLMLGVVTRTSRHPSLREQSLTHPILKKKERKIRR